MDYTSDEDPFENMDNSYDDVDYELHDSNLSSNSSCSETSSEFKKRRQYMVGTG